MENKLGRLEKAMNTVRSNVIHSFFSELFGFAVLTVTVPKQFRAFCRYSETFSKVRGDQTYEFGGSSSDERFSEWGKH